MFILWDKVSWNMTKLKCIFAVSVPAAGASGDFQQVLDLNSVCVGRLL